MSDKPEVYELDETNFANHVWVADKASFEEPLSVHLKVSKKERVAIMIYESPSDEYVGSVDTGELEGNINFPIEHLTEPGKYKIKLANNADRPAVEIDGGEVYYKG